jgi:hypothetical protein
MDTDKSYIILADDITVTKATTLSNKGTSGSETVHTNVIDLGSHSMSITASDSTGYATGWDANKKTTGSTKAIVVGELNADKSVKTKQSLTLIGNYDNQNATGSETAQLVVTNCTGNTANFSVLTGSSLTLKNLKATGTGAFLFPSGDAAYVSVQNCNLTSTGNYVFGTNAATTDNYNIAVNISDSTLTCTYNAGGNDAGDSCVFMVNVATSEELGAKVTNTVMNGERQCAFVRAGTVDFENVTFNEAGATGSSVANRTTKKCWGSGNECEQGAVIIGNRDADTSYTANAVVSLKDCTINNKVSDKAGNGETVYSLLIANDRTSYHPEVTIENLTFAENSADQQITTWITGDGVEGYLFQSGSSVTVTQIASSTAIKTTKDTTDNSNVDSGGNGQAANDADNT